MREIDNYSDLKLWMKIAEGSSDKPVEPVVVQGLDLDSFGDLLLNLSLKGSLFLGCKMTTVVAGHIVSTGGLVIGDTENRAFACHKATMYTSEELFSGFDPAVPDSYKQTPDWMIYDEYMREGKSHRAPIDVTLMRRLHDHSISDALMEFLCDRKVVAIMGGHSMVRASAEYAKVARIARTLTRAGYLMVSGGGPGAMEATNLGAYFAPFSLDDLSQAINILKVRPDEVKGNRELAGKEYLDKDWLSRAFNVMKTFPLSNENRHKAASVGIPTWFYGHEPPSPFSTHIAKYFANSVREDGLLEIATHGVIFAPGSAGTTQEIFQDACQNHYGTFTYISPMILMGCDHWSNTRPVWPLLKKVARGKLYGELLAMTDDEEEIIRRILSFNPCLYNSDPEQRAEYLNSIGTLR